MPHKEDINSNRMTAGTDKSPKNTAPNGTNTTSPGAPSGVPPPCHPGPPIEVTIRSMMAGANNELQILIPSGCPIGHIKQTLSDRLDILPEKQLLFLGDKPLNDDNATLPSYGVATACTLMMHLKLSSGTNKNASSTDVILFVPNVFPTNNDALRNAIRGMTTSRKSSRARKRERKTDKQSGAWTPQKEAENALTRNRMKNLLKTRRRKREDIIAAGGQPFGESETPDHGSVIGSSDNSVPATPPELATSAAASCSTSASSVLSSAASVVSSIISSSKEGLGIEPPITEKELRMFFDAPETRGELEKTRADLSVPPSSYEEHQQIKKERHSKEKTKCKFCRCKLKLAEQSVLCACEKAFCKKHRAPKDHHCPIDYKQHGRDKLSKDNPKIYDGGKAKGKVV